MKSQLAKSANLSATILFICLLLPLWLLWQLHTQLAFAAQPADIELNGDLSILANPLGIDPLFETTQNLTDTTTTDVELGDLDSDGDLDLFVGNYGEANSVWLNNGDGSFEYVEQTPTISYTMDIALGDLDGDGDLDAFVANGNQANTVWFNNGTGRFERSQQILGTGQSQAVALGDVDGDGDLDAAVANDGDNQLWLNQGDGTFVNSGQTLGALNTRAIAFGDLNKDGYLDVFIGNADLADNEVWFNQGDGTFIDSGQRLGGRTTASLALGDLNNDGTLDVVVGNGLSTPDGNAVWINDGTGTFTKTAQTLGLNGFSVTLGDLNHDGALDIFFGTVFNQFDNDVWINDGTAVFSAQSVSANTGTGAVTLGDLNGNGVLDAVVGNANGDNWVQLNQNRPLFSLDPQTFGSISQDNDIGVAFGDLNGDQLLDLLIGNPSNSRVFINNGQGNFTDIGQGLGNGSSRAVALGDLNGDGYLDAFFANGFAEPNEVWLNDGSGVLSDTLQALGSSTTEAAALGDLNNDGHLDIVTGNTESTGAPNYVWFNNGDGTFTDSGQRLGLSDTRDIVLGDFNSDGTLDLFVANSDIFDPQPNEVWFNDGNGFFTDSGQRLGSLPSEAAAVGDLNGDDHLDIFIANSGNQPDQVWLNNGEGFFENNQQDLGQTGSYGVALGDVDNDGDLDAVTANSNGAINRPNQVWLNDGTGNFTNSNDLLGNAQ